jgi:hypothetical protein
VKNLHESGTKKGALRADILHVCVMSSALLGFRYGEMGEHLLIILCMAAAKLVWGVMRRAREVSPSRSQRGSYM